MSNLKQEIGTSNRIRKFENVPVQVLTKTGRRGWQARFTIGFFRSVFILVGAFPPTTVPTTSPEKPSQISRHGCKTNQKECTSGD